MTYIELLKSDLRANNPLRRGAIGMILGYYFDPGFSCIAMMRTAFSLRGRGWLGRLLSRWFWRRAIVRYGVHISMDSKIGPGLRLPHPVGIVIGSGVVIGSDVAIYQNVTIGRLNESLDTYPIVGSGSVIYAGAVVVGQVIIGEGALIAANAVVLSDIPSLALAAGVPAKIYVK